MIVLDTSVLSHLQKRDPVGASIATAMASSVDQDYRITTVNAYEMLGGAIELIRDLRKQPQKKHGARVSAIPGATGLPISLVREGPPV